VQITAVQIRLDKDATKIVTLSRQAEVPEAHRAAADAAGAVGVLAEWSY
jgi:hypothetical protein